MVNIRDFFEEAKGSYSRRPLFIYMVRGNRIEVEFETFLQDLTCLAAKYYAHFGNKKHIAIVADNTYRYFLHNLAIMYSGNVSVPMNQTNPLERLLEFASMSDADAILCDPDWKTDFSDAPQEVVTFDQVEAWSGENVLLAPISEEDYCLMIASSGTTGTSKMVALNHRNLFSQSTAAEMELDDVKEDNAPTLTLLPFYHIGGTDLTLQLIKWGCTVFFATAKNMMDVVEHEKFHEIVCVPSMLNRILIAAEKSEVIREQLYQLDRMFCVGAPFSGSVAETLAGYGIRLRIAYGLSEATGTVTGVGDYKLGGCGKKMAWSQVKLVDGEIWIKGPRVITSYYHNPQADATSFEDGWFKTGDLGEFDEEGYLFIRGRKKFIIILENGENVCPEELEKALYQCNLVRECLVSEREGKIHATILATNPGDAAVEDEIHAFIKKTNQKLPLTHKIKTVTFTDQELPKTATGKVLRTNL